MSLYAQQVDTGVSKVQAKEEMSAEERAWADEVLGTGSRPAA